jgi:hypothetical protein
MRARRPVKKNKKRGNWSAVTEETRARKVNREKKERKQITDETRRNRALQAQRIGHGVSDVYFFSWFLRVERVDDLGIIRVVVVEMVIEGSSIALSLVDGVNGVAGGVRGWLGEVSSEGVSEPEPE